MRYTALLAILLPGLAWAQIALVTDLAGTAGELAILSEIKPNTTVELKGTMTVLYYASGDQYSLRGPARIAFGPAAPTVLEGAPAQRADADPKAARVKPGGVGVAPATFVMRSAATPELRSRIEAARPAPNATVAERVRYATWLEQLQLRDEARVYWKALAAERPDSHHLKELASR